MDEHGLRDAMPNMIMIDLYVRHYFRGEVVKTLVDAGLKVHCFGAGWDRLECNHPENIVNGNVLESFGCLQQISKAKVSLNVMPWFKDGAHDRVFNSMLNGAVCVTDWSKYMTEILQDGKDVIFYELDDLPALPIKSALCLLIAADGKRCSRMHTIRQQHRIRGRIGHNIYIKKYFARYIKYGMMKNILIERIGKWRLLWLERKGKSKENIRSCGWVLK